MDYVIVRMQRIHYRCLNVISKGSGLLVIPKIPISSGSRLPCGQDNSYRCSNATRKRKVSISAKDLPKHLRGPKNVQAIFKRTENTVLNTEFIGFVYLFVFVAMIA